MTLNDVEIGSRVKTARGEMSQVDLAQSMRQAGFMWSQAAVWSTEKGERSLKLSEAVELCEILGIQIEQLGATTPSPRVDADTFDRKRFDKWIGPRYDLAASGKQQLAMYERALRALIYADSINAGGGPADDIRRLADMALRLRPAQIPTTFRGKWSDPYMYGW